MNGTSVEDSSSGDIATATVATHEHLPVATVAGVAVATTQNQKTHTSVTLNTSLADMVKSYSGEPATATVATSATPKRLHIVTSQNDATVLAERWQWFLSLATEHGIHPDVVGAEFPTDADRLDIFAHGNDDETLRVWMQTVCKDPKVRRRQQDYQNGRWVPVYPNGEEML